MELDQLINQFTNYNGYLISETILLILLIKFYKCLMSISSFYNKAWTYSIALNVTLAP